MKYFRRKILSIIAIAIVLALCVASAFLSGCSGANQGLEEGRNGKESGMSAHN